MMETLHTSTSHITPLPKALSYISGLDDILMGGLPRGRTTIINGGPGSGKTLMGIEFLYQGALAGEPGIFIGFEEPAWQIRQNAATLGWDLESMENQNRLVILESRLPTALDISGSFSLKGLLAAINGKSREIGAKRIVLDALEIALRLFDTPQQVRNELHGLNNWLHESQLTTLMTIRPPAKGVGSMFEEFFDSMGDCVIRMETRILDQIATQRLRIIKYRGSGFGRNEYPYVITESGMRIAPISTVQLQHQRLGEKISTGIESLDAILEGGYRRASCVLFAGLPGTGKTLLASTFTNAACQRGERILYISFEESSQALAGNMESAGLQLWNHVTENRLEFLTHMPESMGAEDHYIRAVDRIDAFKPHHVVVDAISACERMGGKLSAFEYLMRILNYCKDRGISIILINQTSGSTNYMEVSGNGISSMVDTVIFLSYIDGAGETNRILQVLKSRGSGHSNQKREYVITNEGIRIMDGYLGEGQLLTGTARKIQEAKDGEESQRLEFEIEATELELRRLMSLRENKLSRQKTHYQQPTGQKPGSDPLPPSLCRTDGEEEHTDA